MRSVIDILDLSVAEIAELLATANDIIDHHEKYENILRGRKLATLFFEPSTRTRMSSPWPVAILHQLPRVNQLPIPSELSAIMLISLPCVIILKGRLLWPVRVELYRLSMLVMVAIAIQPRLWLIYWLFIGKRATLIIWLLGFVVIWNMEEQSIPWSMRCPAMPMSDSFWFHQRN